MRRLDLFQEIHEAELISGPGNIIKQTFTPTKNYLAGLRIPISNPKLGSSDRYQLSIIDDQNQTIRQQTVTGSNLGWQTSLRYDFAAITGSANKKFTLSFAYLGKNPQDEDALTKINLGYWDNQKPDEITPQTIDSIQKNYVHLAYSTSNSYAYGEAMINDTILPGDLSFETYYQVDGANYFKDAINDIKLRTFQDLSFFIFYIFIIVVLTGLFISRLMKSSLKIIADKKEAINKV